MQRDRAKYLFHAIKNNFNPFHFEQDHRVIIANDPKMIIVVLYEARTFPFTVENTCYYKTGKVVLQIDKDGKKIIEASNNEKNKLPESFLLDYVFLVKVYIDISNFENLDLEDYVTVSLKNNNFKGYYTIRAIEEYGISQGLYIVLSHYDISIKRELFF